MVTLTIRAMFPWYSCFSNLIYTKCQYIALNSMFSLALSVTVQPGPRLLTITLCCTTISCQDVSQHKQIDWQMKEKLNMIINLTKINCKKFGFFDKSTQDELFLLLSEMHKTFFLFFISYFSLKIIMSHFFLQINKI